MVFLLYPDLEGAVASAQPTGLQAGFWSGGLGSVAFGLRKLGAAIALLRAAKREAWSV